jgi:hypothetical protein
VSASIWDKPGPLNDAEWEGVRIHACMGPSPGDLQPDLVTVEPGGAVIHGIDEFVAYGKGFAELSSTPATRCLRSTVQGNRAVVERTYKGTHTGPLA